MASAGNRNHEQALLESLHTQCMRQSFVEQARAGALLNSD
jgi:hypothetical protein